MPAPKVESTPTPTPKVEVASTWSTAKSDLVKKIEERQQESPYRGVDQRKSTAVYSEGLFDSFDTKPVVGSNYQLIDTVIDVHHDQQTDVTYVVTIGAFSTQASGKPLYRVVTGTPPAAGIGTPLRCVATFLGYTENRMPKFEYVSEKW